VKGLGEWGAEIVWNFTAMELYFSLEDKINFKLKRKHIYLCLWLKEKLL